MLKPGGRLAVSDIALKKPLPPEIGQDLMAYVGCIAGADPDRGLPPATGRGGVRRTSRSSTRGADLNAYAKVENQARLLLARRPRACPWPSRAAARRRQPSDDGLHARLLDLLRRYNVNDYAASVRVFAVKP